MLFTHPSLFSPEGSQEMSFYQSIGNYFIKDINDAITYKNLYNWHFLLFGITIILSVTVPSGSNYLNSLRLSNLNYQVRVIISTLFSHWYNWHKIIVNVYWVFYIKNTLPKLNFCILFILYFPSPFTLSVPSSHYLNFCVQMMHVLCLAPFYGYR